VDFVKKVYLEATGTTALAYFITDKNVFKRTSLFSSFSSPTEAKAFPEDARKTEALRRGERRRLPQHLQHKAGAKKVEKGREKVEQKIDERRKRRLRRVDRRIGEGFVG
jgi:hypothetical protein